MSQRTALPGEINYAPIDRYSLAHGFIGVALGLAGLGFWQTVGIAVAWEVLEHFLKNLVPAVFAYPSQDTLVNSFGDVISTMMGWAVATAIRQRRQQLFGLR
jgi:hypothetical protein